MIKKVLRIAVQKSGRLSEKSLKLLQNSGFTFEVSGKELISRCTNFPLEILFLRANDIPEIVYDGTADLGICGQNTIAEKKLSLFEIEKLVFGKCRLSIAVPEQTNGDFKLSQKRIATSYPNILASFLESKSIEAKIIKISGSVEIAPTLNVSDAICDLVSTGSTLKMNGLKEFQTIFKSEVVLVSSQDFPEDKQDILKNFLIRVRAVLSAQKFKYVIMNAPKNSLDEIKQLLPGLKDPTVSDLSGGDWVSVASVVEENVFWETIEKLKTAGATGILVLPIEKMIL